MKTPYLSTEGVKTIFRPFLTLLLVIIWMLFIYQGIDYPKEYGYLTAACVLEWVGERFIKRIKELK